MHITCISFAYHTHLISQDNLAAYEEGEGEQRGASKSAKQKREERLAKRRTGRFQMD